MVPSKLCVHNSRFLPHKIHFVRNSVHLQLCTKITKYNLHANSLKFQQLEPNYTYKSLKKYIQIA